MLVGKDKLENSTLLSHWLIKEYIFISFIDTIRPRGNIESRLGVC